MKHKLLAPRTSFNGTMPRSFAWMINALCLHFQIDIALALSAVLGICSAMVHDKFTVRVRDNITGAGFDEPLSLFCIGIANSSERKSPLLKWLKRPILKILEIISSNELEKQSRVECERTIAMDEAKKIRKKITSLPAESPERVRLVDRLLELDKIIQQPKITPLRMFLQDATAISTADFMQAQPGNSCAIVDAEGGSFDAILSDHRLMVLLLSGFSNESISFERSSRASVDIASPHATMCILTQDVKFHNVAKRKNTWDEGFIPRSLIFITNEKAGYRSTAIGEDIPQEIVDFWEDNCKRFLNLKYPEDCNGNRDYYVLNLSPKAADVWQDFSHQLEARMRPESPTYNLRAWLGKMKGVAARIAAIYHLFDSRTLHDGDISGLHMQQACELIFALEWHMAEIAKLYFPADHSFSNAVHKIVNWLNQEHGAIEFFIVREMYRELNIKPDLAHQACGYLENQGVLQRGAIQVLNKPGRRSSPIYYVNYFHLRQQYPYAQY